MSSEVETSLNISVLTKLTTTKTISFLHFGRKDKTEYAPQSLQRHREFRATQAFFDRMNTN